MIFSVFILTADRAYVDKYVTAKRKSTAPLYLKVNSTDPATHQLKNGENVKYQYLSTSGNWMYVKFKEKILTTKTTGVYPSYFHYKSYIIASGKLYLALLTCFILFVITSFKFSIRKKVFLRVKRRLDDTLSEVKQAKQQLHNHKQRLNQSTDNLLHAKSSNRALVDEKSQLSNDNKRIQKAFNTVNDSLKIAAAKNKKLISINGQLSEEIGIAKQQLIEAKMVKQQLINKLKNELDEFYKKESAIKYEPTLHEMKASEKRLISQLDKQVAEGKIFGVDFKHKHYESILKGRQFEIYIATWLTKELGFEIEEWTPDKGVDQDITVKQNLNPDLIVSNHSGDMFAIECKYRGKFSVIEDVSESVRWSYMYQGCRYRDFQKEKNHPVYVALGVAGPADKPDMVAMMPIKPLISNSSGTIFPGETKKQFVITKQKIKALDEMKSTLFSQCEPVL
ncbi:hypothetical protein [Cognaticolwellia mytili]|uniref:hypothetical protein n=1 Tax=Cognaticolwellia mytili TaxID=1888913 RepID=UPI00117E8E0A|nr:hypothetical protein [Cognaticolwellia mytili]